MMFVLVGVCKDVGVSIVEVNFKLIWDVVLQIKVGEYGYVYVVGFEGWLIVYLDISLVLCNIDMMFFV